MFSFLQKNTARLFAFVATVGMLQLLANSASAQVSITSTSPVTQNFDGIGTTGTASLPSGFKIGRNLATYSAAGTATEQAGGTTGTGVLSGSSAGGLYNFANGVTGSSSDRAVGFLSSGSVTNPCYLHMQLQNNTGSTVTGFTITFDYEKYRSGSRAYNLAVTGGTDGTSYSSVSSGSGDHSFAADANNTVISNPPGTTSKTLTITGLSIANGSSYYIRWSYTGVGGNTNGQGIGIDNISITAVPACSTPTAYSVTGTGSYCAGGSGVAVGLANSQTGVNYQLYNGASTVGSPVAGSTGNPISFGTLTTAATYTAVATTATGGCTANMTGSAVVSINSLPTAYSVTVTGSDHYCAGGAGVTLGLANSQSSVNYQLYNGAATSGSPVAGSTGSPVSFGTRTASGTYTVLATATAGSCTTAMTGSQSVTIDALPTLTVTPSGGASCLSMTASGASTYTWSPATALSASTGATVTASPTVTTTYTVTGTNTLSCTSTATVTVTPASVAITHTSPAAGNAPQGTNDHLLQTYNLAVTSADATLSGLTITTAGTYLSADVNALKCWYSNSPTFSTGTATVVSTYASPGAAGSKTFPSFTPQSISSGSTGYIHITADIDGSATGGSTISVASTSFSNFTICAAVLTGTDPVAPSNTQTITATPCSGTPTAGTASPGPSVICGVGTSTLTLTGGATGSGLTYQWSSSSVNTPPGSNISGATNDTYVASSVAATTYYWCTTTCTASTLSNISAVGVVSVNPVPSSSGATNDGPICASGTVNLSANSSNATSWSWTGPSGFTSTLQDPTATPTTTGTYSLTVSSTGSGCSPTTVYTTSVTVNAAPSSTGATNDGPICVGGTVTLSANSSNATSWTWSGPSGFASTLQNPTATPATTGTYSLTLSNSAASGCSPSTVYTTSVTVNAVPSSSGATNSGPICTGNSVTLTANSTGATAWAWSGPSGYTSTLQNPTASPTATATYSLTVSSTGSGCTPATVYTTSVTVNTTPTVSVTPPSGSSGVVLTASGATTYSWSPASGLSASTGATVTASPTVATTYTVSGTTSGCTDIATVFVNFPGGTATWDFTPGTSGVATTSSNVIVSATNCIATVGNSFGSPSPVINSTSASSGYTGATGGNNIGNAVPVTGNTTFNSGTSPYVNLILTPATGYCLTVSDLDFGMRSTGSGPQAFTVSSDVAGFGTALATGTISNNSTWVLKNQSFTAFTGAPSAPVNLRVYGYGGSGSPVSGTINWRLDDIVATYSVNPAPSLANATNGGAICAGNTLSLFANTPSNVASYSWTGPNSFTSTEQNPTIGTASTTATGTYTVVVNNGTGCTASYTTTATVNPMPASSGATNNSPMCIGGTVTFAANSSNANAWSWTGPSGFTSSLQNPTATPTVTGTYSLTVNNTTTGCNSAVVYTTSVTVNPVPTSTGATNDGPICVGGTVNLSANSTAAAAWSWSGPSGFTSSLQNPTATPTATGTYSLTVSSTGSGCNPSTVYTTSVTVNSVPTSSGATNDGPICIGGTANLSANSTAATSWTWTGPSGFTSSLQNPTATPTVTGTYSLTVSSTGSGCNPSTVYTTSITVNPVPTSSGATNDGPICVGGTANLSANSTGATAWSWSGPSGFTSSLQDPTATPTVTGTYSLTVSSTGSGCNPSTVYTTSVTVNPIPTSSGATNDGPICVGGTANLSANSTAATAWSWSGPSGFASSLQDPTASPTVTGTYSLTVSSTGSGCNPSTVYTTSVTVNPIPTSTGATNDGPICVGGTANLSANSTGATAWSWSGPSGFTSSLQDPTATPTVTGTYSLTVSSTGSGCNPSTVYTTSITVNPVPTSTGATNDGPICVGGTANLSANSTGAISWSWSGPSGFTSTLQNPTASPTVTGTYSLTVSSTGSGCNPSTVYTTSIIVNPVPTSAGATNDGPICIGGTANLSANSTGATAWSWNGPSGFTSSLQNPTATPTATGTYSLTVSSTGSGCNPSTVYTTSTTVNPVPTSSGATNDGPICVGGTANLSANSTGATAWSWSGPSGFASSLQNPAATPIVTGTYSLTVSSTGSGCNPSTVYTTSVTVNPIPTSTGATNDGPICVGGTANLSANSTAATSWSWSGPSGFTSSLQNPAATPTVTGSYSLTLSNTGSGCNPSTVYTTSVTVNPVPASVGATNDGPICVGGTVNLSANSTAAAAWSWSGPSGFTSSLQNPTATPTATGTYSLTVSSTGSGCNPSTVYTTSVTVNPVPSSTGATNNGPICIGADAVLSANSSNTTSWSWSGPSGFTSTLQNPTITPTATGTYSLTLSSTGSGCNPSTVYTTSITVNPLPSDISGDSVVCAGSATTLTNTGGGTWASSNTGVATIGSVSGTLAGVSSGVAMITYTLPTTCFVTKQVTVNPVPTAISLTGATAVCVNLTTTITPSASGGTWATSDPSIASVDAAGVVTGVAAGVVTLSYSVTNVYGCTTQAATSFTVNALPAASTGDSVVCIGGTIPLANATGGGTWSSSNTSLATVAGTTGVVSGVGTGSVNITYTISTTGCYSLKVVTVNAALASITGTTNVCLGTTTTLAHPVSGGTWTSSNPSRATVNSSTGVVTGVSFGGLTITYTVSTGCYKTVDVFVQNITMAVSGSSLVCAGSSATLSPGSTGGTWTSGNTSVATINASTGVLTGVAAGTADITYSLAGCVAYRVATVNPLPDTIGGNGNICGGGTLSLTNAVSGGTWASGNTSVATIGSASGILTGVSGGTSVISYTISTGCRRTVIVTIGATPAAIAGTFISCPGGATTLTCATGGGTWSSGSTGIATIGSVTGSVTAISTGTATISYNHSGGCTQTAVISVNAAPVASTGDTLVCTGGSISLTNATGGGTWTSGNTAIMTVGSATGVVSGVSVGTTDITYSVAGPGCFTTKSVTAYSTLAAITGSTYVCIGATSALSHEITGGTWSSSNPTRASVDATTGVVTGIAMGVTTITYTVSTGCYRTVSVNVPNVNLGISGSLATCVGTASALSGASSGGTWLSGSTGVATINWSTGVMTAVSPGTSVITYTLAGCTGYRVATVNALPDTISGALSVCAAGTTTLGNATSGGTWSSSNASVATIGSATGIVNGVAAGTANISYTISTGCRRTRVVTIGATPAVITGVHTMCAGSTTTLSSATTGGTWSSASSSVAAVTSSAGASAVISGLTTGTAEISYNHSGGCTRTTTVTVSAEVSAIGGTTTMCIGGTTTLSNTTGGGTWTSSATAKATVGSASGIVTGVAAGTATITYRTSTTCFTTTTVTVTGMPSAITGSYAACVGLTTPLTHGTSGGSWSSSNTSIATVDAATGVVTGISAGAINITYSVSPGCFAVKSMMVYNLPATISGTPTICVGGVRTLTSGGGTGTWSTSDSAVATVHPTLGQVTGASAGTVTITYRITATGCYATREVTVFPTPGAISGSTPVCTGVATTYTDTMSGGVWSSSSASVMTIDSASGDAIAVAGGGTTIRYTMPTGCMVAKPVTVNALPGAIGGTLVVCIDNTTVLTSATSGAAWTSSDSSVATVSGVTATTATILGVNAGVATIYYTNAGGCSRSVTVTVNAALPSISGPDVVCVGNTMTLINTASGGTWSSSITAKATIGMTTGIVTGIANGTTNITYRVGAGCLSVKQVTVNAAVTSITGPTSVCAGQAVTFSSADTGGIWSCAADTIATVNAATGVVSGVAPGTTTITYMLSAGCYKIKSITVKAIPSIAGSSSVAVGAVTTLAGSPAGGTWASSATGTATVGSGSGSVSGISTGSVTITYTISGTGCYATWEMSVYSTTGKPEIANDVMTMYPNPSKGILSVNTNVGGVLAVCSLDGREIAEYAVSSGGTVVQLPVDLAQGVYLCRFKGADGTISVIRLVYQP